MKKEKNYHDWLKTMRKAAWLSIMCIVIIMGITISICIIASKAIDEKLCYVVATVVLIIVVAIGVYTIKMCLETVKNCKERNFNAMVEKMLERIREHEEEESINSKEHDEG